ncbi:MAG: acyl-CoA dehydrogenase [Gammaproteobacteria bacterium TMED92]|nr:MAG: acyl-CoA dehydrogenase [Gammaproteobacteria bacterium TMED92]
MPESLSPELIELRDTCKDFAAKHLTNAHSSPESLGQIREAAKAAGLFTLTQPSNTKQNASQLALCVARETLAATNPHNLESVFGPSAGVLGGVTGPLAESHLAPLLAGEKRASFGFTEPDNVQPTHGTISGDRLVVNGQKSYVTGGGDADFVNCLVHVEDRGPSMVVIDTHLPGVILEKKFVSLDGSHHAAFKFENVTLPSHHIIGEPGQGLPKAMRQIGDTRLLFAAQASGYMLWVLELLKEHLSATDKSGEPRGNKDVVRWHYADLRIQAFAARSMLYRTARLADQGENIVNEAMACKVFATETVGEMVDTAIQLVGGTALVEDHPLAILYRKVRGWRLAEGASDVLRLNIGRGILELDKGRI